MIRKLLYLIVMTLSAAAAQSRPNWGQVTDGRIVYDITGDGITFSLCSFDDGVKMVNLSSCNAFTFTVDSMEADYLDMLPDGIHPGDTVILAGGSFHFFPLDGSCPRSLKQVDPNQDIRDMRHNDSIYVVNCVQRNRKKSVARRPPARLRFDYEHSGLPFLDILTTHCDKAELQKLYDELLRTENATFPLEAYREVLRRTLLAK